MAGVWILIYFYELLVGRYWTFDFYESVRGLTYQIEPTKLSKPCFIPNFPHFSLIYSWVNKAVGLLVNNKPAPVMSTLNFLFLVETSIIKNCYSHIQNTTFPIGPLRGKDNFERPFFFNLPMPYTLIQTPKYAFLLEKSVDLCNFMKTLFISMKGEQLELMSKTGIALSLVLKGEVSLGWYTCWESCQAFVDFLCQYI